MMRAPHTMCVAVRKPSGEIATEEPPVPRMSEKYPLFKRPFLRGLGILGQAMTLGFRALKFSANAALDDGSVKSGSKPAEPPLLDDDGEPAFSGFFIFFFTNLCRCSGHQIRQVRARALPDASPPT